MGAPSGAGMWVSFNRGRTTDADNAQLVAQAVSAGLGWLAVKSGNDGRSTRWLGRGADLLRRAHDAGLQLFTWNYSKPTTWPTEVEHVAQVLDQGVDGHVLDAETEWEWAPGARDFSEVDRRPAARAFVAALRARCPGAWLAHAPIWSPRAHPTFPYAEFGELDAAMPQFYWTAAGMTADAFCARGDAQWRDLLAANPSHTRLVLPVGIAYGHGDPAGDLWTSSPVSCALSPADVAAYLSRYAAPSFFSWDVANRLVWDELERRADARRRALAQIGPVAADPDIDVAHDALPDTLPEVPDPEEKS